ncbi:reverse transcriptase [Gossypium australe]|uniref:Reverse transcriptase n=1 Tax=Gossypium australe TaxID=47621 RepID=A0A5B6WIV1_9ROSI|nr:reverse transcriptase [Gossypium australe]
MRCVRKVSYSVVLNEIQGTEFKPTRAIRQGDPLSLYLFIICVEGFSKLLNKAKWEGKIEGARVGRGELVITHLFFVDDSILFGKATMEGATSMKSVVNEDESIYGQLVNFEKSLIYFSKNNLLEMDQAEVVLSIPLVSRTQPDVIIWRGDKPGENDVVCPICSVGEETVKHIFRDCEFIKQSGITEIDFTTKEKREGYKREDFWRPPKAEQVKANFDAAFSQQYMIAIAGIIIRNHEGFVIGAYTYPLGRIKDPTTTEVKACLQAVIFGEEMGFRDLVVQVDALTVIKIDLRLATLLMKSKEKESVSLTYILSLPLERQMKQRTPLQLEVMERNIQYTPLKRLKMQRKGNVVFERR